MCWTPLSAHKHKADNIGYRRQRKITTKNKTQNTICVGHHYPHKTQSRQHSVQKTKRKNNKKQKQNTICAGHHYPHTNTKPTT